MCAAVRRVTRCLRKRSRALCTFHWWMPWERSFRTAAARSTFSALSMDSRAFASSSGIRTVMTFMEDARVTHVYKRNQQDLSNCPLHAGESFQVPTLHRTATPACRGEEAPIQIAEGAGCLRDLVLPQPRHGESFGKQVRVADVRI